jgi:tryptophan synthase alpha chain
MNRLRTTLDGLRQRGEKALGVFLTSGFPSPVDTGALLEAIDTAGADFIELGMPFSDPLAEGLPIQRASTRALRHGTTMADTLRTAERFRQGSRTPLVLMGYVNPILRYGAREFCRDAAASGVDGLILPDLPPEEADLIAAHAEEARLALTFLVAPNTPAPRIRTVAGLCSGFVYAVSVAGVTGSEIASRTAVSEYLKQARMEVGITPLLVGFGIRTPEDAALLSAEADGFVVGSALIRLVEDLWDDPSLDAASRLARVRAFVSDLKAVTVPQSV